MSIPAPVVAARDRLKRWLVNDAFPIWWERGADQAAGGFFDTIALDGSPVPGPKRLRVAARQIYAYAQARHLGWRGPASDVVRHGLRFLAANHRRADGLYRSIASAPGTPTDDSVDIYDQAFVLLAFAAGAQTVGDDILGGEAARFRQRLTAFADPAGGFAEAPGQAAPLLNNPNMHLFESYLTWSAISLDPTWGRLAEAQARLGMSKLIDPATGALGEFFGAGWAAPDAADQEVWPGHQFEWAWLLMRWGLISGHPEGLRAALSLIEIGETCGVDPDRHVAIFALDGALAVKDPTARLWSQTERIKATALAASLTGSSSLWAAAVDACEGLEAYFATPTPGLWYDRITEEGGFIDAPAPASSFYHIVCAITELDGLVGG